MMKKQLIVIFYIVMFFTSTFITKAQNSIDNKLKQAEISYNKEQDNVIFYYDKYNCLIYMGSTVIPLMKVSVNYKYSNHMSQDSLVFDHFVKISCNETFSKCINDPAAPNVYQYIDAIEFSFKEMENAIDFLNKMNEFLFLVKELKICK